MGLQGAQRLLLAQHMLSLAHFAHALLAIRLEGKVAAAPKRPTHHDEPHKRMRAARDGTHLGQIGRRARELARRRLWVLMLLGGRRRAEQGQPGAQHRHREEKNPSMGIWDALTVWREKANIWEFGHAFAV